MEILHTKLFTNSIYLDRFKANNLSKIVNQMKIVQYPECKKDTKYNKVWNIQEKSQKMDKVKRHNYFINTLHLNIQVQHYYFRLYNSNKILNKKCKHLTNNASMSTCLFLYVLSRNKAFLLLLLILQLVIKQFTLILSI